LLIIIAGSISQAAYVRYRQRQLIASGHWPPPAHAVQAKFKTKKRPQMFTVRVGEDVADDELRRWEVMMVRSALTLVSN
jgi:hypothetical protein